MLKMLLLLLLLTAAAAWPLSCAPRLKNMLLKPYDLEPPAFRSL